ncbi:MAG: hypothetical protein KTR31_10320 [Myxococcales bacterium]|nr:hypothetical protein [Myxococcales bacterium]
MSRANQLCRVLAAMAGVACAGPQVETTDPTTATTDTVPTCQTSTTPPPSVDDPWPGCDDFTGPAPVPADNKPGKPVTIGTDCNPPALLDLDAIPDQPSLDDGDSETVAIFEVDGHDLVGKFVSDRDAALGGLVLWQELTLRIPENQLLDLVQFEISTDTDPVAYFNRTGDITASRYGLKLGFSTENFERNQGDLCAPLEPRRGTFDWSLIHEFGHLRGWVDDSWPLFLDTFEDVQGDGEGYPKDGSPVLTGDFVTSYAERADGDEDHAESFTTWVMLDELPPETKGEPLALQKVRWMAAQPGLVQLRQALRITEPDGGDVVVDGAPRLPSALEAIAPPAFLHGVWTQQPEPGETGRQFEFTADTVIESVVQDGTVTKLRDLRELAECGVMSRFASTLPPTSPEGNPWWSYNATIGDVFDYPYEDSFVYDSDVDALYWSRLFTMEEDLVLTRVP